MKIEELEAIVEERTQGHESVFNPRYDEKLMVAHYMLAEAYNAADNARAQEHFRQAVSQFGAMRRLKAHQSESRYVLMKDPMAIIAQEVQDQREIDSCSSTLWQLGAGIGASADDLARLLMAPQYKGLFSYDKNKGISRLLGRLYSFPRRNAPLSGMSEEPDFFVKKELKEDPYRIIKKPRKELQENITYRIKNPDNGLQENIKPERAGKNSEQENPKNK